MPGNSFGQLFRITTFGESHGGAVGVVIDGCPPGIDITEEDIQAELDRRKPGQSSVTTPRQEPDIVHFLSGVFEGKTTGTPLLMILYNKDAQPGAYDNIKDKFRPGHADFTYLEKYGIRDHRGSGRASGRETAGRVAAGALAKKILVDKDISITAYTLRAAGIQCQERNLDVIEKNPMRACDMNAAQLMTERIEELIEQEDSTGGIIECIISGTPAGLGEPVFSKIDSDLAGAMVSLGAVKGFEIGSGFSCADMTGSEHNDWMDQDGFISNNAGGTLGGITTGQDIIFRIAVKPTSSISKPQKSRDIQGNQVEVITRGRHDPCICPRIVPVVEAMSALVILDHMLRQKAIR